ncbi:MAG: hypothetical protein R3A13_02485 [Bdellovibrionota bacterium]
MLDSPSQKIIKETLNASKQRTIAAIEKIVGDGGIIQYRKADDLIGKCFRRLGNKVLELSAGSLVWISCHDKNLPEGVKGFELAEIDDVQKEGDRLVISFRGDHSHPVLRTLTYEDAPNFQHAFRDSMPVDAFVPPTFKFEDDPIPDFTLGSRVIVCTFFYEIKTPVKLLKLMRDRQDGLMIITTPK